MNDQNIIHIGAKKPIKDNQMIENEPNFNKNYNRKAFNKESNVQSHYNKNIGTSMIKNNNHYKNNNNNNNNNYNNNNKTNYNNRPKIDNKNAENVSYLSPELSQLVAD